VVAASETEIGSVTASHGGTGFYLSRHTFHLKSPSMNAQSHTAEAAAAFARIRRWLPQRPEILIVAALLVAFSGPMLFGSIFQNLIFRPGAVLEGEWWRIVTHPFVHVTWYHLLLDASAFFLLYNSLLEARVTHRLAFVIAGAAGSLLLSWLTAPAIATAGLCGLSGIAHGLMAVSAVEMMRGQPWRSPEWRIGAFTFALVVGKAAYEAVTGHILFGFLYFGLVGDPVAVSHAGGIVGGLLAAVLLPPLARGRNQRLPAPEFSGTLRSE
jgi:rhomboid family GlyGly-CTERM serine protease